jgi:hypothetical protein
MGDTWNCGWRPINGVNGRSIVGSITEQRDFLPGVFLRLLLEDEEFDADIPIKER